MQRCKNLLFGLIGFALVGVVGPTLTGCSTLDPVGEAETVEQKAYAAYGTFVIYEEQGAKLIQDQSVPDNVKQAIQSADAKAKPVAESTRAATLEVARVKKAFKAAESTEDKLILVTQTLDSEIKTFKPLLDQLIEAVD